MPYQYQYRRESAVKKERRKGDILDEKTLSDLVKETSCLNFSLWYLAAKRAGDICLSLLGVILLFPLVLCAAAAIKLQDGGKCIYSQIRLTKNGKKFRIYKLRTMVEDAEKNGPVLCQNHDSRITAAGAFLRRTKIDELPQLFNILKGDMSIVGPRPERPELEEKYVGKLPEFAVRLKVRSGLTGYAQVRGPYDASPEDKLKMDLFYMTNCSVLFDLKIMFWTVRYLFRAVRPKGRAKAEKQEWQQEWRNKPREIQCDHPII